MKQFPIAAFCLTFVFGCSKSGDDETASAKGFSPAKSSRELAKEFFAQLTASNKQALLNATLLGAPEDAQKQFIADVGFTGARAQSALSKMTGEKDRFLREGFDDLVNAMKNNGINPSNARMSKVDTSGIGKIPSAETGKSKVSGGELVLHFTSKGRRSRAVVVLNCAKLSGGWVIIDEPEVSTTRGAVANNRPRPGGPIMPGNPGSIGGLGANPGETTNYDDQWLTDLPAALARAKREGKHVFLDFTGSDWCAPCKSLHRNVLTRKQFMDFAKDNLVLVVLDFPKHKQQSFSLKRKNEALSKKYEVGGFPTVIVLNADGEIVHRESGYSGEGAAAFLAKLTVKLAQ